MILQSDFAKIQAKDCEFLANPYKDIENTKGEDDDFDDEEEQPEQKLKINQFSKLICSRKDMINE